MLDLHVAKKNRRREPGRDRKILLVTTKQDGNVAVKMGLVTKHVEAHRSQVRYKQKQKTTVFICTASRLLISVLGRKMIILSQQCSRNI